MSVEVTPRCWRITDILTDHVLSSSPVPYEDDNPEFDFSVILDPNGTPLETAVFTDTTVPSAPKVYITRNSLIVAAGANNPIATSGQLKVVARHTVDGYSAKTAIKPMTLDFTVSTALQSGTNRFFGALTKNVASASVSLGTGFHTFDIKTA